MNKVNELIRVKPLIVIVFTVIALTFTWTEASAVSLDCMDHGECLHGIVDGVPMAGPALGDLCCNGKCRAGSCCADLDCTTGSARKCCEISHLSLTCGLAYHRCQECCYSSDCPAARPSCNDQGVCVECNFSNTCPPERPICNAGVCVEDTTGTSYTEPTPAPTSW